MEQKGLEGRGCIKYATQMLNFVNDFFKPIFIKRD